MCVFLCSRVAKQQSERGNEVVSLRKWFPFWHSNVFLILFLSYFARKAKKLWVVNETVSHLEKPKNGRNMCLPLRLFEFSCQKVAKFCAEINSARFARYFARWDFSSDFQTLCFFRICGINVGKDLQWFMPTVTSSSIVPPAITDVLCSRAKIENRFKMQSNFILFSRREMQKSLPCLHKRNSKIAEVRTDSFH